MNVRIVFAALLAVLTSLPAHAAITKQWFLLQFLQKEQDHYRFLLGVWLLILLFG